MRVKNQVASAASRPVRSPACTVLVWSSRHRSARQESPWPFGEPAHLKKKRTRFRVMRKRSAQDLDGNLTVEPCIAGVPDFAHPTCAQWGEDFMWAKSLVRRKCHFFTPAAQFVHTVSGALGSVSTTALIRNRCPSAVTA